MIRPGREGSTLTSSETRKVEQWSPRPELFLGVVLDAVESCCFRARGGGYGRIGA